MRRLEPLLGRIGGCEPCIPYVFLLRACAEEGSTGRAYEARNFRASG